MTVYPDVTYHINTITEHVNFTPTIGPCIMEIAPWLPISEPSDS